MEQMRKDRNTEWIRLAPQWLTKEGRNLVTIFLGRAIILYEARIEADDNKTENGFAREFAGKDKAMTANYGGETINWPTRGLWAFPVFLPWIVRQLNR